MKTKLNTTKYKYFKERSPWVNTKVLGIKDLFDSLIPSEQNAFCILKIF